jgi:hypothetical protein
MGGRCSVAVGHGGHDGGGGGGGGDGGRSVSERWVTAEESRPGRSRKKNVPVCEG